jgi:hypothetical protein
LAEDDGLPVGLGDCPDLRRLVPVYFGVNGWHGTNAFICLTDQAGERVLLLTSSTFINNRGDEALGSPALMDTERA